MSESSWGETVLACVSQDSTFAQAVAVTAKGEMSKANARPSRKGNQSLDTASADMPD
jgi:hypothetical protein